MTTRSLGAVDYVLLVILLLSSAVIGAIFGFFKSKKNSAKEFLLGNLILKITLIFGFVSIFCFFLANGGMGVSTSMKNGYLCLHEEFFD